MRAISVKEPFATRIANGVKREELRTRNIKIGPLLICSNGFALCMVDVAETVERGAKSWVWRLARPRRVRPFPVRSFGWVVNIDDDLLEYETRPMKRRARRVGPRAKEPYTFTIGDDPIPNESAASPAAARRRARELATKHRVAFVWIERDGIAVSREAAE